MSRSVVLHAVKQGRNNRMETIAMAIIPVVQAIQPDAKCSRQNALTVAKTLRYRLNPARVDRYIAVIAIAK